MAGAWHYLLHTHQTSVAYAPDISCIRTRHQLHTHQTSGYTHSRVTTRLILWKCNVWLLRKRSNILDRETTPPILDALHSAHKVCSYRTKHDSTMLLHRHTTYHIPHTRTTTMLSQFLWKKNHILYTLFIGVAISSDCLRIQDLFQRHNSNVKDLLL